ncbi:unnamed protein product [Amoebophrya sp. A25]|nr:unnamed protein product [Amoebophrya sp. A25]|eukprot:GSA25T00007134001.1
MSSPTPLPLSPSPLPTGASGYPMSAGSWEIDPGVGIGPFRLKQSVNEVLAIIQQLSVNAEVILPTGAKNQGDDISVKLQDFGMHLVFDSYWQILLCICVSTAASEEMKEVDDVENNIRAVEDEASSSSSTSSCTNKAGGDGGEQGPSSVLSESDRVKSVTRTTSADAGSGEATSSRGDKKDDSSDDKERAAGTGADEPSAPRRSEQDSVDPLLTCKKDDLHDDGGGWVEAKSKKKRKSVTKGGPGGGKNQQKGGSSSSSKGRGKKGGAGSKDGKADDRGSGPADLTLAGEGGSPGGADAERALGGGKQSDEESTLEFGTGVAKPRLHRLSYRYKNQACGELRTLDAVEAIFGTPHSGPSNEEDSQAAGQAHYPGLVFEFDEEEGSPPGGKGNEVDLETPSRMKEAQARSSSRTPAVELEATTITSTSASSKPKGRFWILPSNIGSPDALSKYTPPIPVVSTAIVRVGIGLQFLDKRVIRFGASCQDIISELGSPDAVVESRRIITRNPKPNSPSSKTSNRRDYFWSFYARGVDVLLNGESHSVCKIVLHTNAVTHHRFGRYERSFFKIPLNGTAVAKAKATSSHFLNRGRAAAEGDGAGEVGRSSGVGASSGSTTAVLGSPGGCLEPDPLLRTVCIDPRWEFRDVQAMIGEGSSSSSSTSKFPLVLATASVSSATGYAASPSSAASQVALPAAVLGEPGENIKEMSTTTCDTINSATATTASPLSPASVPALGRASAYYGYPGIIFEKQDNLLCSVTLTTISPGEELPACFSIGKD